MNRPKDWSDNPIWDFTLAVYGKPGVSDALITLQDQRGADVNVLLYCGWYAVSGRGKLDDTALEIIARIGAEWQNEVVVPLRELRRRMKGNAMGAPARLSDAVREDIKALELDGERVAQEILYDQGRDAPASSENLEMRTANARENIAGYLRAIGAAPNADEVAMILLIANAAAEVD